MASNWNLLMEGMARSELSPNESRVLLAIARKTFGFRKQTDAISLSQLERLTELDKRSIRRSLTGPNGLLNRQIVYRSGTGRGRGNTFSYTINLDAGSWKEAMTLNGEEKCASTSSFRKGIKGDTEGQKKGTPARTTRGTSTRERVDAPSGRRVSSFTHAEVFDVFEAAGGTFYSDDGRQKFGSQINTALKRGFGRDVVLAAAREIGRKNRFGLISEIESIQSGGMPCVHAWLEHRALTVEQLRECPCATCAEWVAHHQRAKLTVLEGGKVGVA